jgi:hypothetical protein
MTNSNRAIPATISDSESFVDPNGRVFEWRQSLSHARAGFAARWKQLSERGVIAGLVRDGLLIESD